MLQRSWTLPAIRPAWSAGARLSLHRKCGKACGNGCEKRGKRAQIPASERIAQPFGHTSLTSSSTTLYIKNTHPLQPFLCTLTKMIFCFHNSSCKRTVTAARISIMKRPSVTLVLSLFTVLAAMAPAVASTEIPLSTPPSIIAADGVQSTAAVASDGHDFFAVWLDGRGGDIAVYGARITADGTLLDPTGIRIASGYNRASVVWTGSSYLVMLSSSFSCTAAVARIDRDQTLASPSRQVLDGVAREPTHPA